MHCIFIHSTGGNPQETFFPWARAQLEAKGIRTSAPSLPSSEWPDREGWKLDELRTEEGQLDEVFRRITLPDTVRK